MHTHTEAVRPGNAFLLACAGLAAGIWLAGGAATAWCYRDRLAERLRCWPMKP